jgi:hypothetical protein
MEYVRAFTQSHIDSRLGGAARVETHERSQGPIIRHQGPWARERWVFDRLPGPAATRAKKSVDLIAKVERGYANNHGHLFPEWVLFLLNKDRSSSIAQLVQNFIDRVGAANDGWENRFARKFGLVYAALKLGVRSGLLPWPADLPMKVVKKCYRKARRAAQTDRELKREAPQKLMRLITEPGRMINVMRKPATVPIRITSKTVALQFNDRGTAKLGLLDGALKGVFGSKRAKDLFIAGLRNAGMLAKGHGHAGTVQKRMPIQLDGHVIKKPRLWVLDLATFRSHFQKQQTGLGVKTAPRNRGPTV